MTDDYSYRPRVRDVHGVLHLSFMSWPVSQVVCGYQLRHPHEVVSAVYTPGQKARGTICPDCMGRGDD